MLVVACISSHGFGHGARVAALLQAYPEAATEKDEYGRLPLHCVGRGASEAMVLAVLHAYPEAAKEKDEDEKLPLEDWVINTEAHPLPVHK